MEQLLCSAAAATRAPPVSLAGEPAGVRRAFVESIADYPELAADPEVWAELGRMIADDDVNVRAGALKALQRVPARLRGHRRRSAAGDRQGGGDRRVRASIVGALRGARDVA